MVLGFVDEVTDALDVRAEFDLSKFRNVPEALVASPVDKLTVSIEVSVPSAEEAVEDVPELDPVILQLAAASARTLAETRL